MSETQGGVPASAPVQPAQVIDLDHHRVQQLEKELAETRRRLKKQERKRLRATVKMRRLQRKLGCCDRKLAALRERLARQDHDDRPIARP
jgi:hypothetical protein